MAKMDYAGILDMINRNQIEELKKELEMQLYLNELDKTPGARQRYSAMKKYFTYTKHCRPDEPSMHLPHRIEVKGHPVIEDGFYTVFFNGFSIALTPESCQDMEMYDEGESGPYPDIIKFFNFDGEEDGINFNAVIAKAKVKGYKIKRQEVFDNPHYALIYKNAYYNIGALDALHSIINDGEICYVWKREGDTMPILFKSGIGYGLILPVHMGDEKKEETTFIDINKF